LKIATSLLEKKFKKSVVGAAGLNNKYISLPNKAAGCAYIEKDIIYVGNTLCWLIVADRAVRSLMAFVGNFCVWSFATAAAGSYMDISQHASDSQHHSLIENLVSTLKFYINSVFQRILLYVCCLFFRRQTSIVYS
jgi:hypothetical protein